MKYDLRKIMLRAWKNYRKASGEITFAEALHRAWLSAKAETVNEQLIEAAKTAAGVQEETNTYSGWKSLGYEVIHGSSKGKPYTRQIIDRIMKNITKAYNRQSDKVLTMPLLSAHIFRHTYCSRMAESGMSPKVLQGIVGHESITTTMDVYTDLDFEVVQEQADEIDKRIQKIG